MFISETVKVNRWQKAITKRIGIVYNCTDEFNTEAFEAKKKRDIYLNITGKKNKETNKKEHKLKQYDRKNVNQDQIFYHFNSGSLVHNYQTRHASFASLSIICIGNSMICSDIWHKYHQWYFKVVIRVKFETILKYHEWYLPQILRTNHAIICYLLIVLPGNGL